MLTFVRENARKNTEQALDVLRSGLAIHRSGIEAGRLLLAQADIEAERNAWPVVSALCQQAAATTSHSESEKTISAAEIELDACMIGARAFLTQNKDADALLMAQQCLKVARHSFPPGDTNEYVSLRRWRALTLATTLAALAQHASGDLDSAADSFESALAMIDSSTELASQSERDTMLHQALRQIAAFQSAQGKAEDAGALAARAIAGAASTPTDELSTTDELHIRRESLFDARLQAAQAAMDQYKWEEAEHQLEMAEKLCDSSSSEEEEGQQRPTTPAAQVRLAIVLLLLASIYARTARVTLSEGLFREVGKLLTLNPRGLEHTPVAVHPSLASLACWRYTQLLCALPKRTSETESWHRLGTGLYNEAPIRSVLGPEAVFGTISALKGGPDNSWGQGIVVDSLIKRVLPRNVH